jgi:hypothetical protein
MLYKLPYSLKVCLADCHNADYNYSWYGYAEGHDAELVVLNVIMLSANALTVIV